MHLLSKSDFQLASTCPKKLVYKKAGYKTANDTNEYMEMLAQGGYVVGKMATLLFPEGIEIEGNTQACLKQTSELLQRDQAVLFEPAIQAGQKIARIDILVKKGNTFHLIEVKAKSHNTDDAPDSNKLKKYIEDVAYQYLVLQEAFPDATIKCSLLMPDKAKRTTIDELAGWFLVRKKEKTTDQEVDELPAQQKPAFNKPEVLFKYENAPDRASYISRLQAEGILEYLEVTEEIQQMQPMIKQSAENFLRILNNGIDAGDFKINKGCKTCEFNTPNLAQNGYKECWGSLAYMEPNIFDLYYGGALKNAHKEFYFDELISEKKTSLFDVDPERLKNSKGELGTRGRRQIIQLENTKTNSEWISPELKTVIDSLSYPLHFIDFETFTGALPFHKGMRPYELIAFQWSCHTIKSPGAAPEHMEWIHTGSKFPDANAFPNFEFARSLMQHIGSSGTPLMWATHENTVLRTILNQMEIFDLHDQPLEQWLMDITSDKDREGRLVDMGDSIWVTP